MQGSDAGGDSAGGGQLNDEDLDRVTGGRQSPRPAGPARSWSDVLTDPDLLVPFDPAPAPERPPDGKHGR
jgi:hypothetical protein